MIESTTALNIGYWFIGIGSIIGVLLIVLGIGLLIVLVLEAIHKKALKRIQAIVSNAEYYRNLTELQRSGIEINSENVKKIIELWNSDSKSSEFVYIEDLK